METWIGDIKMLSQASLGMQQSIQQLLDKFSSVCSSSSLTVPIQPTIIQPLLRSTSSSTEALNACLEDLQLMMEAVSSAVQQQTPESLGLLFQWMSLLFNQLGMFHSDMSSSVTSCNVEFKKTRTLIMSRIAASSQPASTTRGAASASTVVAPSLKVDVGAAASDAESAEQPVKKKKKKSKDKDKDKDDAPHEKKKKKKVVVAEAEEAEEQQEVPKATPPVEEAKPWAQARRETTPKTTSPKNVVERKTFSTVPDSSIAETKPTTFQEIEPPVRKKPTALQSTNAVVVEEKKAPDVTELGKKAPVVDKKANSKPVTKIPSDEPIYLSVKSTVADSLGPMITKSRPDVFSACEKLIVKDPLMTYFIRAPDASSSLGHLFVRCWLNDDAMTDFSCNVLETDAIDMEAFRSVNGDVSTPPDDDLSEFPSAGWRTSRADDQGTALHTAFAFVQGGNLFHNKTLLIHDVLVGTNAVKEELLHVISPVANAPEFFGVQVFTKEQKKSSKSSGMKAPAMAEMIQSQVLDHCGYSEATSDEVQDGTIEPEAPDSPKDAPPPEDDIEIPAKDKNAKKKTFVQQAMGIGASIVNLPIAGAKAAGSAIAGVAGGVMRTNLEANFRKNFPQYSAEELVDTFNCALNDGPLLKQGILYVTRTRLCFQATVLDVEFEVDFDEIRELKKQKTAVIFDNAIEIITQTDDTWFLSSFLNRNEAFKILSRLWKESSSLR